MDGAALIAVVAASRARASGSEYPDCATCVAAVDGRAIEAHALKVSATTTDFIMLSPWPIGSEFPLIAWRRGTEFRKQLGYHTISATAEVRFLKLIANIKGSVGYGL